MSNRSAKMALSQSAEGSFVGTGAAINIALGFKPRFLVLFNLTDGTTMWISFSGIAEGTAIQIDTAVSLLGSNGLSRLEGGFSAGSSVSVSGKTIQYFAMI